MAESTTRSEYPSRAEVQRRKSIEQERLRETKKQARGATASKIVLSASLERLALKLGKSADDLALKIPKDTLRRMLAPVIEQDHDDGSVSYKEQIDIIPDGRRGLIVK